MFNCLKAGMFGIALMAGAATGCTSAPAPEADAAHSALPELPGQTIAVDLCSGCHAVGRTGDSPHPDALPFREISLRYPVRDLEEALGEGIFVGHPDMPPFVFAPEDIDALLTYIEAIQDPA
jgi:mono/diheme cytochrome c family protein